MMILYIKILLGSGCRPNHLQGEQHHPAADRGHHHRPPGSLQPDAPGQHYARFSSGARVGSGLVGGGRRVASEDGLVPL